jgi:hypothetical protein
MVNHAFGGGVNCLRHINIDVNFYVAELMWAQHLSRKVLRKAKGLASRISNYLRRFQYYHPQIKSQIMHHCKSSRLNRGVLKRCKGTSLSLMGEGWIQKLLYQDLATTFRIEPSYEST